MKATLSTKIYPLVIETTVDESGSPGSYYAKGHMHEPAAFALAVESESSQYGDLAISAPDESEIEYHFYRKRPLLPAEREEWDFGHWVDSGKPGTPGAFPAMVVYVG